MPPRIRHCVECPNCSTRYLVGFSPYGNGSYVMPAASESSDEYTLSCFCKKPPLCTRGRWTQLKAYSVTSSAYDRGYGTPREIVARR